MRWTLGAVCLGLALLVGGAAAAQDAEPQTGPTMVVGDGPPPSPMAEALQRGRTDTPASARVVSGLGLLVLMGIAWALSSNRRRVPWRIVGYGLGLQLLFGLLVLRTDTGRAAFQVLNEGVVRLMGYARASASLLFGELVDKVPFAFAVLPSIIFFSALMSVLYHLRIMQKIVWFFAVVMQRTMRTSGAETLSAAANIFVGQTESPLLIRPYLDKMTRSELMAVMVGGFATVAGGVFVAYVSMFGGVFPDLAGHLMTASIMSAPAALLIAKLMLPEEEVPVTLGQKASGDPSEATNVIDAGARGAADGLVLTANVAAMLLAFVALIYLLNGLVGWAGDLVGYEGLTFQKLLGVAMAPLAWVMGVPWTDAPAIGELLGTKTVLNEFFAYAEMARMVTDGTLKEPRSALIAAYALCGFANFGSVAIQVRGIGILAPHRRAELARLGLRAMVGGSLAGFMTAAVAGLLI